jgi:hypothetical protein
MSYFDKSKEQVINELLDSKNKIAFLKHQLTERIKELNCHNYVSEFTSNPSLSLCEVIEKITNILPPSFQFPEIAEACIWYNDREFKSSNFNRNGVLISHNLQIGNKIIGKIEVSYPKEIENKKIPVFLHEESNLLKALDFQILYQKRKMKMLYKKAKIFIKI